MGGGESEEATRDSFFRYYGSWKCKTPHGKLYTLNFIDDCSQKAWIYIIKRKNEAYEHFKDWRALVKTEAGQRVIIFWTDNGGEYSSKEFEAYLQRQGIQHQVTAPYTSAQNGKAEQLHQTLFNRACAIMSENNFPQKLWGECICTAAYIQDHIPTRTIEDMTPYEAYYSVRERGSLYGEFYDLKYGLFSFFLDKN